MDYFRARLSYKSKITVGLTKRSVFSLFNTQLHDVISHLGFLVHNTTVWNRVQMVSNVTYPCPCRKRPCLASLEGIDNPAKHLVLPLPQQLLGSHLESLPSLSSLEAVFSETLAGQEESLISSEYLRSRLRATRIV